MTAVEALRAELARHRKIVAALEHALAAIEGGDEPPATRPPARRTVARAAAAPAGGGRTCMRCGKAKPASAFHKQKRGLNGLASSCKECKATGNKKRRADEAASKPASPKPAAPTNRLDLIRAAAQRGGGTL